MPELRQVTSLKFYRSIVNSSCSNNKSSSVRGFRRSAYATENFCFLAQFNDSNMKFTKSDKTDKARCFVSTVVSSLSNLFSANQSIA